LSLPFQGDKTCLISHHHSKHGRI